MKRIKHILITAMVLVTVAMFANADIPPAPAGLDNDTGDYWVNYTWSKELDDPVNNNVTDSFNVSMNGTWYNGTATFLNKGVGPGGWANITVWAYNATGNGNMSVGSVSDNVQAPAMVDPPDNNPYTIMHPDSETLMEWIARYNAAPRVNISRDGVMALPDEYSVLDRLDYNATERDQGVCGNCWMWAGTGCMEVAHDAENDVFDRLSIQYLNSLYSSPCCEGWLSDLSDFYSVNTTIAVPWNNTNASWQDGSTTCGGSASVPAASIATMPHYAITHIEERTILTQGEEQPAIENIKSVLASNNSVWFGFFLPNNADWDNFTDFWLYDSETDLWSPDYSCGHTWEEPGGGGHAVLCVGYNDSPDIEPYWIMLNSWGTANGNRSSGLFRMNMSINYDCYFVDGGNYYSLYWQMLDIDFADICVNETGWWRHGSEFNENTTAPIQAAVDAAEEGETICVAAGSYTENVNIGTSNLTLAGEGADVVNVSADSTLDHVFEVTADYVNISGFNVTGATANKKAGIYLNGRQHCNISDNSASNNYYGIWLNSSSNNTVTKNNASDGDHGIYLRYSSNNMVTNNTADSNTYTGIRLWYSSNNNTLTNNTANSNDRHGIYLKNSSNNNTVTNNTANSNDDYGIYLYDSSNDNTLTSNNASGNEVGILLDDSSNNTLTGNTALGNGCGIMLGAGMMAEGVGNNTTSDNFGRRSPVSSKDILADTDTSDKGYGIGLGEGVEMVEDASNNTLTGNTASGNRVGIWLEYSSSNTLTSNTASNNGVGIMLVYLSNYNMLTDNDASNNDYGIWLVDSSNDNTLTSNNASGNGEVGIALVDSSNNTLTSNTASNNWVGIMLGAGMMAESVGNKTASNNFGRRSPVSSNNTLTGNDASGNEGGIWLYGASNNTLTSNTADSNTYTGIRLWYSSNNNTLTNNTANSNDDYGIYVYDSSNNTLANNTMSGNTYNFGVDGSSLSHYIQTIYPNNTVDGKPIYYWVDQSDGQIPTDAGYVGVVSSTNIIVRDLNLAKNLQGILFVNTSDSTIDNVTTSDNDYCGIWLGHSSNDNTLTSNNASGNEVGIWLYGASNNTLTSNTASNNWVGIYIIEESSNNTLSGNIANSNIAAPVLPANGGPPGSGIVLEDSSNNTLTSNTASDNSDWDIYIDDSPSNTFTDNTLNGTTVSLTYSGDISLKGVGLPAAGEPGWYSIGKFINATNHSEGAWMFLNFSYSDSDLTGNVVESSLAVWKHNGTAWVKDGWDNGRYLDTTGNVVGVNITTFSVFAPMGVPPLHHINVTPTSKILGVNESQNFTATGYDQNGREICEYFVFDWHRNDAYIGRFTEINDTATNFTAEHVGRTYITASNGSVTSDQVQVTVDGAEPANKTLDNGTAIATSGDANVTCNFGDDVDDGWINITAIGNATNSSEVNPSDPRYGLGDGDKAVSGVTVNVSDNILAELAAGNGTIRIQICYNATTLAALGIDASTLAIWKYDNDTDTWVKQPSTTTSEGCVYADVNHLCTYGLIGSKAASTPSGGSSGGSGTYPPGWFGTPTPTVTATKALAASATGATTPAPPGERVTPAPTKVKPVAAKAAAPAAEGTTAGTAKKSAPGFTAIFAIAGMLAVAYAMMRRRG